MYYPGDIIIIKDIIFKDGTKDPHKDGRPCLVLYTEKNNKGEEKLIYVPFTSDGTHKNKVIDLKCSKQLKHCNVSEIHEVNLKTWVKKNEAVDNIGEYYFQVVKNIFEYHKKTKCLYTKNYLHILSNIYDNHEYIKKTIIKRKAVIRSKSIIMEEEIRKSSAYKQKLNRSRTSTKKLKHLKEKSLKLIENDCYFD